MILVPGITFSQCPTSYSGEMTPAVDYTAICGFLSTNAKINIIPGLTEFEVWGRMDVKFSTNVQISHYVILQNYVTNVVVNPDKKGLSFLIGDVCEPVNITDEDNLVQIIFNVMSGSSATVETSDTRIAIGCVSICSNYSEEDPTDIDVDPFELNGKLLAPGQFSCSGGRSIDHGLPDRKVSISMAESPAWVLCEDIETNAYGYYECEELREDCNYEICVVGPDDELCGLDEFDLDIIRDLVLAVICEFDYEWQHFAADANNDGTISTADIASINAYLSNQSYDIPLAWKYVSNTQFDDFVPDCNNRVDVPIVTNCSELTVDSDPEIEDWYGFPTGDMTYSCTDCGLRGNPSVLTRNGQDLIELQIQKSKDNTILIHFDHEMPISVWSLALKLDIDVSLIRSVTVLNNAGEGLIWNVNREHNYLKMVFTELEAKQIKSIDLQIKIAKHFNCNPNTWSIHWDDQRINNVLIDNHHKSYHWGNIKTNTTGNPVLYPNPAGEKVFVFGVEEGILFKIFDAKGCFIMDHYNTNNGLDVSRLNPGLYFLDFTLFEGNMKMKFIKY